MHDALARALDAGATVVTPNRRLARHLIDAYDRAKRAAGLRAWASARVLPSSAWLAELEREAIAAGALAPRPRVTDHAAAELWRRAVDADGDDTLDARALAASASQAWDDLHAYGEGDERWRTWRGDDEPAAFARWADRYQDELTALGVTDAAGAPGRLAQAARSMEAWRGRRAVLVGFIAPEPGLRRVVGALRDAGMVVDELDHLANERTVPRSVAFASAGDELAAALAWARAEVEGDPDLRVGIVIPDLATRLVEVRRAARDRLGAPGDDARAPAWNVSLGPPLAEVPLVATALGLLALAWSTLPVGQASALLRSRHLPAPADDARLARARAERAWLERGVRFVRADDARRALERAGDPLAARFASLRDLARGTRSARRRDWIDAWRGALRAAGWPGRALGSDEHQAAASLDELFAAFASVDAVASGPRSAKLAGADAVRELAQWAAATPFQPESPPAPIQIVGLIESIGLPFDALWLTGMSDDAWPRSARPHPLLPVRWQREHGVPRSDAAAELAWAREVTSRWLQAAARLIVSRAPTAEQREANASALFADAAASSVALPPSAAREAFDARVPLETLEDVMAPAFAPGESARATASTLEAQSACPFQALAAKRWDTEGWPAPAIGLTAAERGTLVHAALEAFFAGVRDSAALAALVADAVALSRACADAGRRSLARLGPERWQHVPDAVRAGEAARVARQVEQWIREVEAKRPPFTVAATEAMVGLALGPLALSLRLDRVDALGGGGVAIVDYKTGVAPSVKRWTAERPEATQLALYSLAWRAAHPDAPVRATAIGQVRPGDCAVVGMFADASLRFDAEAAKSQVVPDDWTAFERARDAQVVSLARSFATGESPVAPRRPSECRNCGRQSLCRIGELAEDVEEGDEA